MSLTSAMFTGVSGLMNNGAAMNVIGNNISNVNTTGFKEGRTLFSDLLSQSAGANSQVGTGVQTQAVQNIFSQGTTQNTTNVTDLAIQGNSFFALKSPSTAAPVGSQSAAFLTRAGAFNVDKNLTLVNPDGYQVLDTSGNPIKFSDNAANIKTAAAAFNTGGTVGLATTAITADIATAQAAVTAMSAGAAQNAAQAMVTAATAANTTATNLNTTFTATPSGTGADAVNNAVATAYAALQAAATAAGGTSVAGSAATVSSVTTAYNNVSAEEGKAFSKITKIDSTGTITYLGADGVTQLNYDTSGNLGVSVAGAPPANKIATVNAADPGALTKIGGSLYQASAKAGVPAGGFTLTGNQANGTSNQLLSNTLEASNVDMASEFVNMIVTQRAYSANSKTITTTDQMTQEVLGLIR